MSRFVYLLAVVVLLATTSCANLIPATMQDVEDLRGDLQGEIDEAIDKVNDAIKKQKEILQDGIAADQPLEEVLPDVFSVEVDGVTHTSPRQGSLRAILELLFTVLGVGAAGATGSTVLSRARRGVSIVTGKKRPARKTR
jgi:hypothetical protein